MSGHSKWHKIRHKKAATDAKQGKIFTKHAKLIAVAARTGGDPDMNPGLRMAIDNAKADNMPNDNIERAIKKGTGEGKDAANIEEVMYEGFGPGGIAVFIQSLTDNRNRTIANLKTIMSKKGGSMGAAGSVGYLFKHMGLITVAVGDKNVEEIELAAIDAGATDVDRDEDLVQIYTDASALMQVREKLEQSGINSKSAELVYEPQTEVKVDDQEVADKIMDLVDALEEDEDVSTVFTNADIEV